VFSLSCGRTTFALVTGGSFTFFQKSAMACVSSAARPHDDATDTSSEGHGSGDSAERTYSILLSDVGSHSGVRDDTDEVSSTWSYYFGSSIMRVSCIRG
jgi:hypothetical protein